MNVFNRCLEDEQLTKELGYLIPLIGTNYHKILADQFKPTREIDQKRLNALIKREPEIFKTVDYEDQVTPLPNL